MRRSFICAFVRLCDQPYARLSVFLSVRVSFCLWVHPSIHPYIRVVGVANMKKKGNLSFITTIMLIKVGVDTFRRTFIQECHSKAVMLAVFFQMLANQVDLGRFWSYG